MNNFILKAVQMQALIMLAMPVQKYLLLAVTAPKIPATATHPRKNMRMLILHSGFSMKNDQTRPAAKNHCKAPDWQPILW